MRSVFVIAGVSVGVSAALSNVALAVSYVVDSVGILAPNPSALNIALGTGSNLTLDNARLLMATAHANGTGGVVDFQQQFQGGTFPNATQSNNGIDFGAGPTNPLLVTGSSAPGTGGLVATGPTLLSLYRLESTATGTTTGTVGTNNIDSNTNQGGNIISGGYKSRNPGTGTNYDGSARDGNAVVGPVDFTGGIPTVDLGIVNAGGSYIGITGQASPATLVFTTPLSYFGITALPRGAARDTTITLSLSDSSTVVLGNDIVAADAIFFSYQLSPAQVTAGLGITRAAITNPNGTGQNRYDDLAFVLAPVAVAEATWNLASGGSYDVAGNWQPTTVPNGIGATANFGGTITAASVVDMPTAVKLGKARFNSANAYTLSGAGSLGFDAASGNASVDVTLGAHVVSVATTLVDSTDVTASAGTSLTISGPLTFSAGTQLSALGAGTTRINATAVTGAAGASVRSNGGTLELNADLGDGVDLRADAGLLRISATQHARSLSVTSQTTITDDAAVHFVKVPTLSVGAAGVVDITDNVIIVDYADGGSSPLATVTALVASGRGTGGWNGLGIRSANAAATAGQAVGIGEASAIGSPATYRGEPVDGSSVIVTLTLAGDANLDRSVNFADLVRLAQNYNTATGGLWTNGDFNYDGAINFADLVSLAQGYNGTLAIDGLDSSFAADWALAQSLVPEPMSGLMLATAALSLTRRARRRTVG